MHKLQMEWMWPTNTNTTGSAKSDSVPRYGEHSNHNTAERQGIIERDNSRRQMLQERGAHTQRKLKTNLTQKRLDKLSPRYPYDNGYRTAKKTVPLVVNKITLDDVMRLNNQKRTGTNTWDLYFGNKDMKSNNSKGLGQGGNRSRTDNVLGMNMNERRTLADMVEFECEDEIHFDDYDYNGDSHVPVPRSPIKKIQRSLMEDDVPKRNFGDYDPVRPRYLPRTGEVRTRLPEKLDKRRVIYKGISEENVKIRRQQEEKLQQDSDWRAELIKSYDQNLGKYYRSSEKDNDYHRASTYNEIRSSDSRSAINSRPVSSSSEEEEDDYSEGYARRYQVPQAAFTSQEITEETKYKLQYIMSEGQDTHRGSYPGWKLPSQAQDSKRVQANVSNTYERRPALASTSTAQKQPLSSWMDYTQGTGFFQPSANPKVDAKTPGTSPVNEGYVTKEGNLDARSYDSRFELGRNESQFADEIYKLDYFYRLKKRPIEEKHGIEYFGFLLEFWPKDAPDLTEVVFGYQMTDEAQAQDSVFAAGLMRLKNTHKKNAEAIRLRKIEKAKARGYLYHQNPIYSTLGPSSTFESSYVKPNQPSAAIVEEDTYKRISASINVDRYSVDEEVKGEGYMTVPKEARSLSTEGKANTYCPEEKDSHSRYESYVPKRTEAVKRVEARSHLTERKSDSYYPEEKETDSRYESYVPKRTEAIKKDKEDNFRIAIPRGPSIVWDTRRGGSSERNRPPSRSGLGYHGRK